MLILLSDHLFSIFNLHITSFWWNKMLYMIYDCIIFGIKWQILIYLNCYVNLTVLCMWVQLLRTFVVQENIYHDWYFLSSAGHKVLKRQKCMDHNTVTPSLVEYHRVLKQGCLNKHYFCIPHNTHKSSAFLIPYSTIVCSLQLWFTVVKEEPTVNKLREWKLLNFLLHFPEIRRF